MQRQFPSNAEPRAMAGRRAYPALPSLTAAPASAEAGWRVGRIPAHAGGHGGHVRLKVLHRGGPG